MANTKKYAEGLKEVGRLAKEFSESIRHATNDSFEWGLNEMAESYLSMFERFCPFKEGDCVELLRDVPCDGSGWYTCRHFLIRGSKATVDGCGYRDDKFVFDVIFDNETWIDGNGDEQPVDLKHTFGIDETYFRRFDEPKSNDNE